MFPSDTDTSPVRKVQNSVKIFSQDILTRAIYNTNKKSKKLSFGFQYFFIGFVILNILNYSFYYTASGLSFRSFLKNIVLSHI